MTIATTDRAALKKVASKIIEKRADELIEFARDIGRNPEVGFQEFRTSRKLAEAVEKAGLTVERGLAITGFKAKHEFSGDGPTVAIIAELDSLRVPGHELADPEANVIFGTVKDPKMDDEVKITLVAASFPMAQDNLMNRQEELRRLLRESVTTNGGDELDVPSFLRKEAISRTKGYFG